MDIGEETADDHSKAITCDGPGRMLTRGAGTEVLASHEDTAGISGIVQHEVRIGSAIGIIPPIAEQVITEETFLTRRCFQETGGDNLVCVHILQRERHTSTGYDVEFLFHNNVRGSVITPVTAAAAATSGDARIVRAPGP